MPRPPCSKPRGTFGDQAEQELGETLGIVATTAQEMGVHIGARARALLDSHSVSFRGRYHFPAQ